ncbi:MAG: ROK family protein [Eubacteriales bacterium]|nr:ROK family protein [Eubacteriales bacterium]
MAVIGIDTGGTKIAGALMDESGKILKKMRLPNTGRTGGSIMDAYRCIIRELGKDAEYEAVGIGAGGRIEEHSGKVLYAVEIYKDYIGLEIKKILEQEFGKPVFVTNDCRAGLLGEVWLGAAKNYQKVLALILGTGVGGGVFYDGVLLDGSRGGMGEFGHMILHNGGRLCACGQRGCAEQYLSGTALWQRYNERVAKADDVGKRVGMKQGAETKISSGYDFFKRQSQGDSLAGEILKEFTEDLAVCLVNLANAFDPDALLIGGGLIDTREIWWDEMKQTYISLGNLYVKHIPLLAAAYGNDAALAGAAKFALDGLRRNRGQ